MEDVNGQALSAQCLNERRERLFADQWPQQVGRGDDSENNDQDRTASAVERGTFVEGGVEAVLPETPIDKPYSRKRTPVANQATEAMTPFHLAATRCNEATHSPGVSRG